MINALQQAVKQRDDTIQQMTAVMIRNENTAPQPEVSQDQASGGKLNQHVTEEQLCRQAETVNPNESEMVNQGLKEIVQTGNVPNQEISVISDSQTGQLRDVDDSISPAQQRPTTTEAVFDATRVRVDDMMMNHEQLCEQVELLAGQRMLLQGMQVDVDAMAPSRGTMHDTTDASSTNGNNDQHGGSSQRLLTDSNVNVVQLTAQSGVVRDDTSDTTSLPTSKGDIVASSDGSQMDIVIALRNALLEVQEENKQLRASQLVMSQSLHDTDVDDRAQSCDSDLHDTIHQAGQVMCQDDERVSPGVVSVYGICICCLHVCDAFI